MLIDVRRYDIRFIYRDFVRRSASYDAVKVIEKP